MKFITVLFSFLILCLTIFFIALLMIARNNTTQNQQQISPKADIAILGSIPYWDQKNAFTSFQKHTDAFDFISLFWYRLDSEGNITTYEQTKEDLKIIEYAHRNNVKVMALIANLPDYTEGENADWDYRRVNRVIATPDARKKHISELVQLVKRNNFDGLDIDYEALRKSQREDFSIFIEELGEALHSEGKLLGVAIHPKTGEYIPSEDNGSHAQDLKRIADASDHMYFMTYLEHGPFSDPGPLGSPVWIRKILDYAVLDLSLPPQKIFLGISLIGAAWEENDNGIYESINDNMTYEKIINLKEKSNSEIQWNEESKSVHLTYTEDDNNRIIWFENAESVNEKLTLVAEYNLGGVLFWRLGGEDNRVWDGIQ